jgi:hypothetical protein
VSARVAPSDQRWLPYFVRSFFRSSFFLLHTPGRVLDFSLARASDEPPLTRTRTFEGDDVGRRVHDGAVGCMDKENIKKEEKKKKGLARESPAGDIGMGGEHQ